MPRWISFDDASATALRGHAIETEAVWADLDPVTEVLRTQAAVLVLPSQHGDVLVARFRRAAQPTDAGFDVARWSDDNAVGYTAGGMLGLLDEPVYEEEEAPAKKKWWKRIIE